jgi:hypothetical protein
MLNEFPTITVETAEVKQPKLIIDACKNRVLGSIYRGPAVPENSREQNRAGWYLSYGLEPGERQEALIERPEAGGLR